MRILGQRAFTWVVTIANRQVRGTRRRPMRERRSSSMDCFRRRKVGEHRYSTFLNANTQCTLTGMEKRAAGGGSWRISMAGWFRPTPACCCWARRTEPSG
jgi:hypothetical protein